MRGILFNLLEEYTKERAGLAAWYAALEAASGTKETVFVGPETYADELFERLLNEASAHLESGADATLQTLGRTAVPKLQERYPQFFTGREDPMGMFMALERVVNDLRKLFPEENPTMVGYRYEAPDRLRMTYASPRRLCLFLEGLLRGIGEQLSADVRFEQKTCMLRGDPLCRFEIVFPVMIRESSDHE